MAPQAPYFPTPAARSDLWVYDLARDIATQLTFAGEVVDEVAWARDSRHVVYQDGNSLWWTRSDGAGPKQLLMDGQDWGRRHSARVRFRSDLPVSHSPRHPEVYPMSGPYPST